MLTEDVRALGSDEHNYSRQKADAEELLSNIAAAYPEADVYLFRPCMIVSAIPLLPAEAQWVNAIKVPVLVDCGKARRELGWKPEHHALETMAETVAVARERGVLPWPGILP